MDYSDDNYGKIRTVKCAPILVPRICFEFSLTVFIYLSDALYRSRSFKPNFFKFGTKIPTCNSLLQFVGQQRNLMRLTPNIHKKQNQQVVFSPKHWFQEQQRINFIWFYVYKNKQCFGWLHNVALQWRIHILFVRHHTLIIQNCPTFE